MQYLICITDYKPRMLILPEYLLGYKGYHIKIRVLVKKPMGKLNPTGIIETTIECQIGNTGQTPPPIQKVFREERRTWTEKGCYYIQEVFL